MIKLMYIMYTLDSRTLHNLGYDSIMMYINCLIDNFQPIQIVHVLTMTLQKHMLQ